MIGDTENIFEFFRSMPSPVCVLLLLPVILMTAPFSPVSATRDFPVFRMQQYDLNGVKYGSRSAVVNLEVRSLTAENLIRRCALVRAVELNTEQLQKAIQDGLSALLILLPADLNQLPAETKELLHGLENELHVMQVPIPIYFTHESDDLQNLYREVALSKSSDAAASALKAMTTVASANSFHFVTDGSESKALHDFPIVSIFGKLTGQGLEDQLPTVAIVTHYDSFSIIPKLSLGVDNTGSGVVAFLEIVRLFSKLYERSKTQPKYNMLFLLAGGGKFNYQGTKKWIEENIESSEISLLSEVDYVLCLDALGSGTDINLHVSKPPKEATPAFMLYQELKQVAEHLYPSSSFNLIHKKVNLAEDILAWEHERFSLRRLPAGTLSHHTKPDRSARETIFDTTLDKKVLIRNINIIAEGLARHLFNLTGKGFPLSTTVFAEDLGVDENFVSAWIEELSSQPRSQQIITKDSKLVSYFEETMSLHLKDVRRVITRADKKDPEFLFYDAYESKISVYSVKPALFDLFLACGIASYLGLVYVLVENFSVLTAMLPKPSVDGKVGH